MKRQCLYLGGDFIGSINLDFERPNYVFASAQNRNVFLVNYFDLYKNTYASEISAGSSNNLFSVSPNPSKGFISIDVNSKAKELGVSIFDYSGKKLVNKIMQNNGNLDLNDLSGVNNGLYLIQVSDGYDSFSAKVIINK